MRGTPGTVLRASWLATALASLLAVTTPLTARLAGEAAATPSATPTVAVVAAPVPGGLRGAPVATRVLASEGRSTQHDAAPTSASIADAAPTPDAAPKPEPYLLVHVPSGLVAHRSSWSSSPAVGTVAPSSKYYHVPLVLWVESTNAKGTWGRVDLPYVWPRREGWIPLGGLQRETTWITVKVDLSEHTVRVYKRDDLLYHVAGAIGAPSSPTPAGDYVVTDRVPFSPGSALGSFAFGISGIQPRLPAGWSGGNQLAIHGTNSPSSLGQSVSAGCVRVSEWALDRFMPLLRLGTPVLIRP